MMIVERNYLSVKVFELFFVLFLIILLGSHALFGQKIGGYFTHHKLNLSRFSIALNIGGAGISSDLVDTNSDALMAISPTNFSSIVQVNYRLTNYLSLRAGLGYCHTFVQADQRWEFKIPYPIRTHIADAHILVVHDLTSRHKIQRSSRWINPYFTAGYGGFYYSPYNLFSGRDIRSERRQNGEKVFPTLANQFLLGMGIELYVNSCFSVGGEWLYRYTNTDYLDAVNPIDYQTRSQSFDHFFTFGVRLQYTFRATKFAGYNYHRHLKRRHHRRPGRRSS